MAETLITLGGLFLLGLLTDLLSRRTSLPRVTLLIAVGFLIRPSVADVLPGEARKWFPLAANALARCLLREMPISRRPRFKRFKKRAGNDLLVEALKRAEARRQTGERPWLSAPGSE